jgi:ribosomal protein S8
LTGNQNAAMHRIHMTGGQCKILHVTAQALIRTGYIQDVQPATKTRPQRKYRFTAKGEQWIKNRS